MNHRKTVSHATKSVTTFREGMEKAYTSIITQMGTKVALSDLLHEYGGKDTP